jgi:hypothetical protein
MVELLPRFRASVAETNLLTQTNAEAEKDRQTLASIQSQDTLADVSRYLALTQQRERHIIEP